MLGYVVSRLLQMIPTLFGVTLLVFMLIFLVPGDPARLMAPEAASAEEVEQLRISLGLDRPVLVQYVTWVSGVVQGDWGTSLYRRAPVLPQLMRRLPATLELVLASVAFSVLIAVPLGVVSALRRNSVVDNVARVFTLFGLAMPNFWVGIMTILVFAYYLRWFPATGRGSWQHLVLPAVTLGAGMLAEMARVMRSTMLEVINSEYVRTARSKGLHERVVVYKHALRNALIGVITIIGLQLGGRLSGAVVVEQVFAYPGVGRLAYQSMVQQDVPLIMGSLLLFAVLFLVINLVVDVLYSVVDPRISYD